MFSDLRGFLDHLRRDRDLVEISAPVDPVLEAAEILLEVPFQLWCSFPWEYGWGSGDQPNRPVM